MPTRVSIKYASGLPAGELLQFVPLTKPIGAFTLGNGTTGTAVFTGRLGCAILETVHRSFCMALRYRVFDIPSQ
jgi:hypothetical protein